MTQQPAAGESKPHPLNDILEPRVMTEAEAVFLESMPVVESPGVRMTVEQRLEIRYKAIENMMKEKYGLVVQLAKSDAALSAAAEQLRAVMEALKESQAENELLRKCLNKMLVNVRNACTILGGELFLGQDEKTRLYEPTLKLHDYLRKLVDDVDKMLGETK